MSKSLPSSRFVAIIVASLMLLGGIEPIAAAQQGAIVYPIGTPNSGTPSGMALPGPDALPGYVEKYSTDFVGSALPEGWVAFSGVPGSDPGAQFGLSHAVVGGGMLSLNAWRDPAYGGEWVTGGVCQCSAPVTYGAFFVRSRLTGPGPTQVEILWPVSGWPPEIDFTETVGGVSSTMATLHYTAANLEIHNALNINMTQWHTFGVVWTPTSVTYVVDGRAWGSVRVAAAIPSQPLTLHLQQQTWCSGSRACPTSNQSTQVDWVAEYVAAGRQTAKVSGFSRGHSSLTSPLRRRIDAIAHTIAASSGTQVAIVGYGDVGTLPVLGARLGTARAHAVAAELRRRLRALGAIATIAANGLPGAATSSPQVRIIYL